MANGDHRWLNIRGHAAVRGADGKVLVVRGTAQDISERVTAEVSLRETLSLLNATLDSTADGIFATDLDGRVTTINERFAEMWRLPPELRHVGVHTSELAEHVLGEVREPDAFVARTVAQHEDVESDSHDVVEFTDGRVFERYSTPQRVGGEVVGRVWTCRDVTETKALQDELQHQAFHDPLTGLANQALFRALVDHAVGRSARTHAPMAVLYIDLDNFKTVNDSLGHNVGDELLVGVTKRLSTCVRSADTTARLGGDEFAVLIDEAGTPDEATIVAERVLESLRQPLQVSGRAMYVSASIGIAFGHPSIDGAQVLRNADLAMYTAKRHGKGRYEVYAPDMHAAAVDRLELEGDLRGAVERGELVLHYQPIVSLADGRVRGAEALVRWDHPTRGLIPPASFVPIAEESTLIDEIGAHVLVVACMQAHTWEQDGPVLMTVNVSPRQLQDEHFVQRVRSVLSVSRLTPSSLVLEITEGAMVHDTERTIECLQSLKALGVRLAIDDFGTGYSSLSYLHRFPIDFVKIDQSFVQQLATGESSLASAIVSMAKALDLTTIAEGVETEEQVALLRGLGCELAQGFHLAPPAPAAVRQPGLLSEHA
jgi:diguanylate cyclase (GGDEF)-like protein/PAS domain S-box-containing protein